MDILWLALAASLLTGLLPGRGRAPRLPRVGPAPRGGPAASKPQRSHSEGTSRAHPTYNQPASNVQRTRNEGASNGGVNGGR